MAGLALTAASPAHATEGASTDLVFGATTFQTPLIPGPGFYYQAYLNQYESSRLNDGTGHTLVPGFQLNLTVEYNEFTYVAPVSFHGVNFATGVVVPIAFAGERAEGSNEFVSGITDILLQPVILGFSEGDFHVAVVQGLYVPNGYYKPTDQVVLGRNTWGIQPQISVGYIPTVGPEFTTTLTYNISTENKNPQAFFANPTGSAYLSGNEFEADYAAGYSFTPNFEAGVTGYLYNQTTADRLADPAANAAFQQDFNGFFGRTFAIGPGIRYLTKYGEFFAEIQQELYAKNRTQGSSYWFRWNISF